MGLFRSDFRFPKGGRLEWRPVTGVSGDDFFPVVTGLETRRHAFLILVASTASR